MTLPSTRVALRRVGRSLSRALFFGAVIATPCSFAVAAAPPGLQVLHEAGADPGEEILYVQGRIDAPISAVCHVVFDIPGWQSLHPSIVSSHLESIRDDGSWVVDVTADFPWPIGRRWSRLEVELFGGRTVAWQQINGSFRQNHGTVILVDRDSSTDVRYWAVIDLGLPRVIARPFENYFVEEFWQAVSQAAIDSE
jgi:hypothetical protein